MSDLVERLRAFNLADPETQLQEFDASPKPWDEAANEIERLRAQVESLTEQLTLESIDTTCHCARVTDLESDLADKATLIEVLLSEIACHMADKREFDASQTERRVRR